MYHAFIPRKCAKHELRASFVDDDNSSTGQAVADRSLSTSLMTTDMTAFRIG